MIFFTSDHHFWHANIIEYCGRPFRKLDGQLDVVAMNEELVRRWNEAVSPGDVVWHLGDFSFGNLKTVIGLAARLAGEKHLVLGNHDRHSPAWYLKSGFAEAVGSKYLEVGGKLLFLTHRPPGVARAMQLGKRPTGERPVDAILCGHVHERWARDEFRGVPVVNVGVDVRGFRPVSWEEISALI